MGEKGLNITVENFLLLLANTYTVCTLLLWVMGWLQRGQEEI